MTLTQAPPLNVARKIFSDLKNSWIKINSFPETFHCYMQGGCRKMKRLWVKDTQAMWKIFKLVVLNYDCWKYSKKFLVDWKGDIVSFYCKNKNGNFHIWKREKHLKLTTVHFKIWNFNSRGSLVNGDKKITLSQIKRFHYSAKWVVKYF